MRRKYENVHPTGRFRRIRTAISCSPDTGWPESPTFANAEEAQAFYDEVIAGEEATGFPYNPATSCEKEDCPFCAFREACEDGERFSSC